MIVDAGIALLPKSDLLCENVAVPNQFDPHKHHRQSIRLKGYDYSATGAYFMTICVDERECVLGNVIDGEVRLNDYGQIVVACWAGLIDHYPHVELDTFVVMPNHAHGVIVIDHDRRGAVSAPTATVLQNGQGEGTSPLPQPTLGQMIAYFKYQSTKRINAQRHNAGTRFWQRNYYEHIIRNDRELNAIREYILYNPLRWDADLDNPINTKRIGSIDAAAYRREAGV